MRTRADQSSCELREEGRGASQTSDGQEAATTAARRSQPGVASILRQQDRGKRSTGLGLRGALLPVDQGEAEGEGAGEATGAGAGNTYPLAERNLLPHLEDTETKRFVRYAHRCQFTRAHTHTYCIIYSN